MAALIINSPFLTLLQGWMVRHLAVPLVAAVGRWAPDFKLPGSVPTHYGVRLHRQYRGEWEHNLTWKPSQVFSITAGWLRVIHTGHRRLLRGGAIILPIPVRHSNRLVKRKKQSKEYFCADGVLKV